MRLLKAIIIGNSICYGVGLLIAVIGNEYFNNPPYYNLFKAAYNQNDVTLIGAIIFILGGISVSSGLLAALNKLKYKKKKRKSFSPETKEKALRRQNYRCNVCGISPEFWDFDHIGDRSDNSLRNCQALCLNCHRKKTTREARQKKRR
jgi:hypothetical protein